MFTNADVRADSTVAEVKGEVAALQAGLAGVDVTVDRKVSEFVAARVQELERPGGTFDGIRKDIQQVSGQVRALERLGDVEQVQSKLLRIDDVSNRLDLFMAQRLEPPR